MRSPRLQRHAFLFLILSTFVLNLFPARANTTIPTPNFYEDEYADEYEVTSRVVRVSLLSGEVSLQRAGSATWERAKLNLPLVEGDTLATARGARLEIQIDSRNFVRVAEDSVLRVVTLRTEGVALSLTEGTATVRLARFEKDKEYFEVDAPKTTVAAEQRGLYRLDVARDGGVRVTVRDGGRARIYSETSGFTLRDKRSAELVYGGNEEGDWELSSAAQFDEWDRWTDDRERYLVANWRFEERERYYDRDVWGAEELDSYGDWSHAGDYGWVWRPRVTVINRYHNWAPYRYGHWSWVPPYGWVWVGDEPWGWAPYHYGRWVYYNDNWCWAPRGYGYAYRRAWWRPSLVNFVYISTSNGGHLAWYPLGYGHRDPHSRNYGRYYGRLSALRRREIANIHRTNPAYLRAVSSAPRGEFGTGGARARPASVELARRAVAAEPLAGRFPVGAPADAGRSVETTATGRTRLNVARPAPNAPARNLPERSTGAAARTPGQSLDGELRRTRIFNNREPRGVVEPGASTGAGGAQPTETRGGNTGAVARPTRPGFNRPTDGRQRGDTTGATGADGGNTSSPSTRPVRRTRPDPIDTEGVTTTTDTPTTDAPARTEPRERRPVFRPQPRVEPEGGETESPRARPSRPAEESAPAPRERVRPAPPENQPDAPQPRQREERRTPPPREDQRTAPPPREERSPAPRQETPPQRSEPAPRQREEQPSSPPPQRERPPAAPRPSRKEAPVPDADN